MNRHQRIIKEIKEEKRKAKEAKEYRTEAEIQHDKFLQVFLSVRPRKMASFMNLVDKLIPLYCGIAIVGVLTCAGFGIYTNIKTSHPNQPIYKDFNNDGIEDKCIQRINRERIFPRLEDEILYGVEINGKTIYLSQEQFKGLKK